MKKIILGAAMLFTTACTFAQDMLGIRNSNYAGVTGLDLNPSSIVDSRLKFDFNLITMGAVVDNNYLFIPKDSLKFVGIKNIINKIDKKSYLDDFEVNGKGKDLYLGFTLQGPSAMVNFGNASLALAFNVRAASNFSDVNFAMAKFAFTDIDYDPLETPYGVPYSHIPFDLNKKYSAKDWEFHSLIWGEWGLTYGQYLWKKDRNAIRAAATVKLLQGIGGGYAENTNIDFFVPDLDPNNPSVKDTAMSVQVNNIDYGRVSYDSYEGKKKYGDFIHGKGFGWNLGFAWELRHKDASRYTYEMDGETHEDPEVNKYKLKIGLSLIDFGKVKFDDEAAGVYNINKNTAGYCDTCNTSSGNAQYYDWYNEDFDSQLDFDTTYSNLFFRNDPNKSRVGNEFSMTLPSAISLQADYNVYKKFYANATIIQGVNHGEHQVERANMLSITPRWEGEWFEAAVPVSYFNNRDLRLGMSFRVGSLFFGSDKVGSLFGLTDLYGMDFYGGIKFSLVRAKPTDKDKDKVSDKNDLCPEVAGLWKFKGCPDRDGDDVQDSQDMCPDEKGLATLQGCPDKDMDGVADKNDDCPDVAGLAQFKGCPDTDGDGIIDGNDKCPSVAGLALYLGCPDSDNDSIPDPDDDCPNKAGLSIFKGCPDTDGDGIPDNKDECPFDVGPASNKGCPVKIVEAPKETAPIKVELTQEEQEIINTVFSNLQFETGKSVIKSSSFESLDKLAELLKKKPNFKLQIDGHTDNVGKPASNLTLSKNRANAAKKYLTDRGIDAARITTNGYGQKKPVASNATPDGRAKNRRVEFTIVQ